MKGKVDNFNNQTVKELLNPDDSIVCNFKSTCQGQKLRYGCVYLVWLCERLTEPALPDSDMPDDAFT